MSKKYVVMFVLCLSLSFKSCITAGYVSVENQEEDKIDAEKVTFLFYNALKGREYKTVHRLFGKKYFAETSRPGLDKRLRSFDDTFGAVSRVELTEWETEVRIGTDLSSEYYLVYNVTRGKGNSAETIRMEKEDGEIKIVSYEVKPQESKKIN